jgi:hypothetical protein
MVLTAYYKGFNYKIQVFLLILLALWDFLVIFGIKFSFLFIVLKLINKDFEQKMPNFIKIWRF